MNPTPEAVAAALALADAPRNSDADYKAMAAVSKYAEGPEFTGETAARILAAEVRRLQIIAINLREAVLTKPRNAAALRDALKAANTI